MNSNHHATSIPPNCGGISDSVPHVCESATNRYAVPIRETFTFAASALGGELDQRYQEIRHKSEPLLDITEVFSGLSHARQSVRLEWIIILIAIEIGLFLVECPPLAGETLD